MASHDTEYANGPLPAHLAAAAYFTGDQREWALPKAEALEYLDWCERQRLRVLGFEVWYPTSPGPTVTDLGVGNVEGIAATRDGILEHSGRYVSGHVVFNITVARLMTVAELASKIASLDGVSPNRAATSADVRATELRLGIAMPSEIRELVMVMDGCNGETPPDSSWTRFWPMREWRPVADSGSTPDFAHAIVFADYCQESWWFAFESISATRTIVAKINGPDRVVSESLAEFLEGVLHNDAKILGLAG